MSHDGVVVQAVGADLRRHAVVVQLADARGDTSRRLEELRQRHRVRHGVADAGRQPVPDRVGQDLRRVRLASGEEATTGWDCTAETGSRRGRTARRAPPACRCSASARGHGSSRDRCSDRRTTMNSTLRLSVGARPGWRANTPTPTRTIANVLRTFIDDPWARRSPQKLGGKPLYAGNAEPTPLDARPTAGQGRPLTTPPTFSASKAQGSSAARPQAVRTTLSGRTESGEASRRCW